MKKFLATAALAAVVAVAAQPVIGAMSMAQTTVQGGVKTQTTVEPSPFAQVMMLPARLVVGTLNTPVGMVNGIGHRSGQAVNWVNSRTLQKVDFSSDPGQSFVLAPAGLVGDTAALGLGAAAGAVEGTFRGFARGFNFDR